MSDLTASVVIVSRHRPAHLRKCLKALEFQNHLNFEVIVVGDGSCVDIVKRTRATFIAFEDANISAARNIGISHASGEVIAFIDDDAIAEPTWLFRLLEPFSDLKVAAAGGFVRGRNGISFQWKGEVIDAAGTSTEMDVDGTTIVRGSKDHCVKTQGTNCAFRRDVLVVMGGFDENFRYFLDETDLNIRLGQAGHSVAIVPSAEVQHGFAANTFRTSKRTPKSLFEIGASLAYFRKKHELPADYLNNSLDEQRRRLVTFMVSGALEPREVDRLLATFQDGIKDGMARTEMPLRSLTKVGQFTPYRSDRNSDGCVFITGRRLDAKRLRVKAKDSADAGHPTTLILLSPTTWRHRRYFHEDGYWVQTGGVFGKSLRTDPPFRLRGYRKRLNREISLLNETRPLEERKSKG